MTENLIFCHATICLPSYHPAPFVYLFLEDIHKPASSFKFNDRKLKEEIKHYIDISYTNC